MLSIQELTETCIWCLATHSMRRVYFDHKYVLLSIKLELKLLF